MYEGGRKAWWAGRRRVGHCQTCHFIVPVRLLLVPILPTPALILTISLIVSILSDRP